MNRFYLLLFLWLLPLRLLSQVSPAEGSALHYTIIGFSVPATPGAADYQLQVARGSYDDEALFDQNIVFSQKGKTSRIVARVPFFGCPYTWRVVSGSGPAKKASPFYHFTTRLIPGVDSEKVRLRVDIKDKARNDAFVFLDFNKVLYDFSGRPVWFLPEIEGIKWEVSVVRDLKITTGGTFTLILNDVPYEINYYGKVLWKGPNDGKVSGDSVEYYHHDFTKLANGHYMVLGNEKVLWQPNEPQDPASPVGNKKIAFGTIIEYDRSGKVIWSWKSSQYHAKSNIKYERPAGSFYDPHQNAFFFDEKGKNIYMSFKNIDQVLKIKYPSGTLMNTYSGNMFCSQHNCRYSRNGYMYMFNNNSCAEPPVPKISVFKESAGGGSQLTKLWEFTCPVQATNTHEGMKPKITSGGSVTELADNSFLASVCSPYADLFIVNRNKKITWYAVPEQWDSEGKKWFVLPQYRISIIERRSELEKAVWNK